MSGAGVRAAVAAYVTAANITNLVEVFADPPFDMANVPADDLTPAGATTTAVGVVFIDTEDDTTIAFDGQGGRRTVTYAVSLEILLWDISADATTAQNATDALIDAVKVRLRTDPKLGTEPAGNNEIIQAAVSRLFVERGRPERPGDGDAWACWTGVHFDVETYEFST